jgi:hypothetical protein
VERLVSIADAYDDPDLSYACLNLRCYIALLGASPPLPC